MVSGSARVTAVTPRQRAARSAVADDHSR